MRDALPKDAQLRDLGPHALKDLDRPEQVYELCSGALPVFPPASSPGLDKGAMRISNADRDRVVTLLRDSCGEGRLTLDEFGDRVGIVYAARTSQELEPVLRDLPVVATTGPAHGKATRWAVSIMGGHHQKSRWRVGRKMRVVAVMGGVTVVSRSEANEQRRRQRAEILLARKTS